MGTFQNAKNVTIYGSSITSVQGNQNRYDITNILNAPNSGNDTPFAHPIFTTYDVELESEVESHLGWSVYRGEIQRDGGKQVKVFIKHYKGDDSIKRFCKDREVFGQLWHPHLLQICGMSGMSLNPFILLRDPSGGSTIDYLQALSSLSSTEKAKRAISMLLEFFSGSETLWGVCPDGVTLTTSNLVINSRGRLSILNYEPTSTGTVDLGRRPKWKDFVTLSANMIGYESFLPIKGSPANSSVMFIAQYLKNVVFTAYKPPTVGPEFIRVIQNIRSAFEHVLGDMELKQSLSLLDALISSPSHLSPFNRLVLDTALDIRCGDIGYLTDPTEEPRFIRLGNVLGCQAFKSLVLQLENLDSENSVDLEPEDAWTIVNDEGLSCRYTLHLDRLERDWVRIDIDHVKGQIPRSIMSDVLHIAWAYLCDNAAAICKEHGTEHNLNPSDLMIILNHRRSSKSSIMSCWTRWTEALQKRSLSSGACDIHFCAKERSGMWGYWSIDGSFDFMDTICFRKDGNGDWQGDDHDLAFIIRSDIQQHVSYIQIPH